MSARTIDAENTALENTSPETTAPRNVIANLDFEETWRRHQGAPARTLPREVLRRLAEAGSLLRVFATDRDRLVLPGPLDPLRLGEGPRPTIIESRNAAALAGPTLYWGTPPDAVTPGAVATSTNDDTNTPLRDRVWGWPSPTAESVAWANHRGGAHELAAMLGVRSPESAIVRDPADVADADWVRSGAEWVVKAPWSAAGRDRVRGEGVPEEATMRSLTRLLESEGEGFLERWQKRGADFGTCAVVLERGPHYAGAHRLVVDRPGHFLGIDVPAELPGTDARLLTEVTLGVGTLLHDRGYRGPYSVDAFRTEGGTMHPLIEINARFSFGWVARAWAESLGPRPDSVFRLRVGEAANSAAPGPIVLLAGATPDAPATITAGWEERERP